ncbi:MAG: glycosyltransferase [Flavobacteriaceae bacterium]
MRILLVGEYSRLHNSLKEGLRELGHQVIIIGNGDGFKNYPVDYSTRAKWFQSKIGNIPRQIIFRIAGFDLVKFEQGIRFFFLSKKLKGFDIVQLINECPIQTQKPFELYLLKKIFKNNKSVFLLSCGVDYLSVKFLLDRKIEKSILKPFFEDKNLKKNYDYVFEYTGSNQKKIHDYIYRNCRGIIASDIDYVIPLNGNKKYLGLVPNPVILNKKFSSPEINENVIRIFLGVNKWNYHQKGVKYFEKALDIIKEKYPEKIEIIIVENIPYKDYINLYNKAHILLDQCFAYDQGYNALEAMAKGKVVFTGAEKEFLEHYNLQEDEVAINAKPDVDYLVEKLSMLIENPSMIEAIGTKARNFIEKEHNYIKIAEKYLAVWNKQKLSEEEEH